MPSGVTTQTALSLIAGVGVVYADVADVSTKVGATSGPPTVNLDVTMRNLADEIDGTTNEIAGMDVIDKQNVEVAFTVAEMTARVLGMGTPGSTSTTTAGVTTITPAQAATLFTPEQYVKNLKVVWKVGPDGLLTMNMPLALCTRSQLGADNRSIGKLQLAFRARLDLTTDGATTDDPNFFWTLDPATVPAP
jgi:hypothetical protein